MGTKHVVLERNTLETAKRILHVADACPERLALASGTFDIVAASADELTTLRGRHKVCDTCQKLEIASSTDRVRYLLSEIGRKPW